MFPCRHSADLPRRVPALDYSVLSCSPSSATHHYPRMQMRETFERMADKNRRIRKNDPPISGLRPPPSILLPPLRMSDPLHQTQTIITLSNTPETHRPHLTGNLRLLPQRNGSNSIPSHRDRFRRSFLFQITESRTASKSVLSPDLLPGYPCIFCRTGTDEN